ncbi:MAG TPA: type II secretion system F family protein [Candidatus Thermoplasmatota archaeon]|nr:type II secretion system F family protein [Candidatus Thermoplasmatota archaeon]
MKTARMLAFGAMAAALVGAAVSLLPIPLAGATFALGAGVLLAAASAWMLGRSERPAAAQTPFRQELAFHASSLVLLVVFILLALVEILAIPAAMGKLVVFSTIGIGFVEYYPILLGALLCALAGAILLASGGAMRPMRPMERALGFAAGALTALFVAASFVVGGGAIGSTGLRAERSVFVLAAALVTLFFFVRAWLRLPSYAEVSAWLEHDERVRESRLLPKLAYSLLAVAGVGVVLSLLPALGAAPRGVGIFGMGVSLLALLFATYNVGVSHVVAKLEMGLENALDARKKRRVVLSAISIALTALQVAVGLLTFLAFLAQTGGVEIFRFLLDAYVAYYVGIFAIVLVPMGAAVAVRTRVKSEVPYSPKLQAMAMLGAATTIVAVFFGVFIGSGLAEGSGIQIENAVLVLGAAIITLIMFVKARTLLPGVVGLIREAVTSSAQADKSAQEIIKKRMVVTYVGALAFVLVFAAFAVANGLGVLPESVSSGLGTDLGFFTYLLVGIGVLVVVVMRYFQSVNIDSRWNKRREENTIGKKRLTSAQVQRYLVLGFSMGLAVLLFAMGLLVQFGAVKQIGPLAADRHVATDLFVFGLLIGLGPYGWFTAREARRTEAIDQKFPEFLRDLAESQRSGMTLTEAVLTASKGQYGVLTSEIRKMAAQIEWGVSFSDALERFAKRVDTPLIERTVSLIIQASSAGGNVVDVLTAAADDAREIQQIVKERKQQMSIYTMIIYIAFAVFIGVIAVLNAQFIPEVAKAVSKADGVSIGGLNFKKFDEDDFKILFFHAAIIQGLGGGIVGGVMAGGKPIHGLRHSFILVVIAWVLFRLIIG